MYPHPFSVGYWRTAANELKDVRKLTFAALCIALCMALAAIPSVPLWGGAKITWGFLARAVCAWVCGPVLGVVFAVAEDLLSFFITGGGGYPFFPGYTLTTMLGVFVYSLFFYKSKITFSRAFWAKLLTNIQNVILGALWMAILSGKAWYVTASGSAIAKHPAKLLPCTSGLPSPITTWAAACLCAKSTMVSSGFSEQSTVISASWLALVQ